MLALFIECFVVCGLFFAFCFLGTGSDEKNIRSFESYPKELQTQLENDENLKGKIRKNKWYITFLINLLMFTIIFFICGIFVRSDSFFKNFASMFILGQILNLFDLVIDLLWRRNTKRVRFTNYPEKELYQDPKSHYISFLKAIVMFTLVALIVGGLITLF